MYTYKTRLFCKNYEGMSDRRMSSAVHSAVDKAFDALREAVGFGVLDTMNVLQSLTDGDQELARGLMKRASTMVAQFYVWEQHAHGSKARMTYADFLRVKEKLHENACVVGLEWEMLQYKLTLEPWFDEYHWVLETGDALCFGRTLTDLQYHYAAELITQKLDELTQKED